MIWVTWRQHRIEALIGVLVLVLLALLLFITGPSIQHAERFQQKVETIVPIILLVSFLPLLVGLFIGAPLVAREVEQGTHHLAWTQSITRLRWLTIKLSVFITTIILAFGALSASLRWWNGPVNPWWTYDVEGTVLVAYTLFAFVLGTAAGTLLRRTVPAIALTFLGFLLARLGVLWLRPHFLPLQRYTWDIGQNDPRAALGDWIIETGQSDSLGHQVSGDYFFQVCGKGSIQTKTILYSCLHDHGIVNFATYHPANQFWIFQTIETSIFLVLAAALVVLTMWLFRYRLT